MKGLFQKIPKVVLFLATNEKAGRDKLQGILRYVRLHTPWQLHLVENRIGEQQLGDLRAWGATGVIVARMPASIQAVKDAGVPTVVLDSPALYREALPRASYVTCDSDAVGGAAAEFLLRQGFKEFAYVPDVAAWDWSARRGQAYAARVRAGGGRCAVYGGGGAAGATDWASEQKRLAAWLLALPRPCAVFAVHDGRARQVVETALAAGLDVPGEIAVLGVDNEEILCENCEPTLSSVQPDFAEGGYRAAEVLERLMRRSLRKPVTLLYGVRRIVERVSGRPSRVVDRRLHRGLEFIRLNAGETLTVADVARHMGVSRRLAELLFRKGLSHSVHDEMQRARLGKLKAFLLETTLPIGQISAQCGYQTEMHAKRVFKKATGLTMSQFRRGGKGKEEGGVRS